MAFHIHRAERTDLLADGLGALLATPPADPFATDVVLVPARGIERWLSQRLSHVLGRGEYADGVCAGVQFRSPRSLIAELSGTTDADPWAPEALVWPLMDAIDASLDRPWCRPLATHLGYFHTGAEAELRLGRRHATARRLAGLFASYAGQRPRLLADWLDGVDSDGIGGDIAADLSWQPPLWRAVASRVPHDPPHIRHRTVCDRLRAAPTALAQRLSLFGQTRLSITDIELLEALSTHHDIHLWIPHPSTARWNSSVGAAGPVPRRQMISIPPSGHPLLTTLSRDLRELQQLLPVQPATDETMAGPTRPDTLLGWLQADLAADAVDSGSRARRDDDRSVQVHSCHGAARQIDVLRDVLLGVLADDPTLEPRDILVMCPDIETYAPLITAAFGLGESVGGHPAHRLRVRLADRSLTQTNPLLGVTAQVLALVGSRAAASDILNLIESDPVRTRFGFTDDDIDTINRWVRESGVRWGFDSAHREPYGLGEFVHNTWQFGIDRILAGVAMSDDSQGWLATTLPLDDVGSNRVELAGRLAEFVSRLQGCIDSLTGSHSLADWLELITAGVMQLTAVRGADGWQLGQLHREFADISDDAGPLSTIPLRLSDIRSLLERRLAGRPTRANFRSGSLTVCTMVPMRSVPHRVVCLVGLDDGVFPRLGSSDGDDVLAREPLTGERDIRAEDRQLLLDAIGAATDTLVITYTGADEHTGRLQPPCVPLAELLDALDRTTSEPVRSAILTQHPLQPFDIRNVTPGASQGPGPFTFDPTALFAAQAAARPAADTPQLFLPEPLPAVDTADIALDDLVTFFGDPVRGFFRHFTLTLPYDVDTIDDVIPVEIDALQSWAVGDRMLDDMLRGRDPDWALHAEWRRGFLPPGQLGWRKAVLIRGQAQRLAAAALALQSAPARAVDVDLDLGAGRRLSGTVAPIYADRFISVRYSTLGAKQLIQAWIRLLAWAAAEPDTDTVVVCIGRDRNGIRERRFVRPAMSPVSVLADLADIYAAGLREPLPLPVKTSLAWAEARQRRRDPRMPALRTWASGNYPGEDAGPAHIRAWGAGTTMDSLLQATPAPGEETPGETTRLGALAARVWAPMLSAELEL